MHLEEQDGTCVVILRIYNVCVHVVAVLEECVRVDAQSSTGRAARLAERPGARYRP